MKSFPHLSIVIAFCFVLSFDSPAVAGDGNRGAKPEPARSSSSAEAGPSSTEMLIPGPLRSFLRMAGISQEISPEDVLPLLSWNISTIGYEGRNHPTEYLILLTRYVAQARELGELAGKEGVIRVAGCDDAGPLLRILGYGVASACGQPGASLITGDPERAFLTIDSGFPLTELEETLQGGKPFEYSFASTVVPAMFSAGDWSVSNKKKNHNRGATAVDTILSDRTVARLYWALSKMDPETADYLRRKLGIGNLLEYGALLDFYGEHICIRHGRVLVPGGREAETGWEDLAGANPSDPVDFIPKLLAKDNGWLVAYFDVLSSVGGRQQAYFTKPARLRKFYDALRPAKPASATEGVFRPAPWLLLLVSQTQWTPQGQPLVPGGIEIWREMLNHWKDPSRLVRYAEKRNIKTADDLLEDMFAISRENVEDGPLQAYLALSEISSRRAQGHGLAPETVRTMCQRFANFSDQFRVFSEFPELSDASILLFVKVAEHLDKLPNPQRDNALGLIQANIGIWQILARQDEIPKTDLEHSWQNVIKPFERVRSSSELYDAGRGSLAQVFRAATAQTTISQDEIVELLAGPQQTTPEGKKIHGEVGDNIRSVLDAQRLVSLDTLTALNDGLRNKASGNPPDEYLFRLADQLHEFQMPQPIFTNSERTQWAPTFYNTRHTDLEMKTNVTKVLKSTRPSPGQIEEARGQLTPFLRDILVGLNYAYYEPPGAQALHVNPLFVRSHDFSGETVEGIRAVWQAPQLFGAGSPAGGGAHFVGSLADLPYALAELEQDFIAPKNVQALIWQELVPSLLISAVLPRWWNVTPAELHAAALYQRSGEELIRASVKDEELRAQVVAILSDRMAPRELEKVEQAIKDGRTPEVLAEMTPADSFYLCGEFQRKYPAQASSTGSPGEELVKLRRQYPEEVSWMRLSHDFGVPHPTLSYSYASELLNFPPLPAFSGFASRLLGESWDASNLYWARLADEAGYSPAVLNRLVPELTEQMIARIFATDLEDWPALLRAMRETGEDFRSGRIASLANTAEVRH
jgi:hypothetical protein